MIDRQRFFERVRASFGPLTQDQVDGFRYLLAVHGWAFFWDDPRWLAYCLSTAWHETAFTMMPVLEYGSEDYLQGKPYYPYVGRGFVQLTWEENYKSMGEKIGVDLMDAHMDRALHPHVAAHVLFAGMRDGDFTGVGLPDYFNASVDDPVNARRIVNGVDCAETIAEYHALFLDAIIAGTVERTIWPT